MSRILMVGTNQAWALERIYIKHLREAGLDIDLFTAPDYFYDWYRKSLLNKILFRAGVRTIYHSINNMLLEKVKSFNPKIIWIFKGMEILPATLQVLKREGYFLANYNPDHPFIIAGRGSGNANVTNAVKYYDLHFCYHGLLQQKINEKYKIPTVFLPFGYEIQENDYANAVQQEEINKICFIGNPDKIRIEIIFNLARQGLAIDVYGHGWNKTKLRKTPDVTVYDAVYSTDFWAKLRQYRIQLNIFRLHNTGSHNMRTFEIPAVGGIQVSPYSKEQALFFEEGKEIFFYKDDAELLRKVKAILALLPQQAAVIRNNARQRSLLSGYSYADRAKTVYNTFKELV